MFRRKSKKKELEDFYDVECGGQQTQGGSSNRSSKFFLESQVTSALEMAQVAMASLRRRAEQSEGESILLSVQLKDEKETNQKRTSKLKQKLEQVRTDLEQKLSKGKKKIEELQKAVADGVVQNARLQQDMAAQARQSKAQLSNLHTAFEEKELQIKQLTSENTKLESELVRLREQEEKMKKAAKASNSNAKADALSSDDVSAAALTLARALAQSGFEGLETEANQTAESVLNLAAALGPNVSHVVPQQEASGDSQANNQEDDNLCVTPQVMNSYSMQQSTDKSSNNQENVNPFLTMSKGKRGYMTAPDHHHRHHHTSFAASAGGINMNMNMNGKGSSVSAKKAVKPLSSSKKMNSSPWSQLPVVGTFLDKWNKPTNSPATATGRKRVTAPFLPAQETGAVDVDLEYSVTSWQ